MCLVSSSQWSHETIRKSAKWPLFLGKGRPIPVPSKFTDVLSQRDCLGSKQAATIACATQIMTWYGWLGFTMRHGAGNVNLPSLSTGNIICLIVILSLHCFQFQSVVVFAIVCTRWHKLSSGSWAVRLWDVIDLRRGSTNVFLAVGTCILFNLFLWVGLCIDRCLEGTCVRASHLDIVEPSIFQKWAMPRRGKPKRNPQDHPERQRKLQPKFTQSVYVLWMQARSRTAQSFTGIFSAKSLMYSTSFEIIIRSGSCCA